MNQHVDPIQAALAQATAAAAEFNPNAVAPTQGAAPTPAAYTAPATPAAPLTADDLMAGSMVVDHWLKVTKFGMTIGSDTTMFSNIPALIDLSEVQYCFAVKYGNPAKYEKTYDHVVSDRGEPWHMVLQRAQSIDPKAYEFRSVDLPFVAREALKKQDGTVLAEQGEILGHSLATTGWKGFQLFLRGIQRAGINIHTATVSVDLGFETRKNDREIWAKVGDA